MKKYILLYLFICTLAISIFIYILNKSMNNDLQLIANQTLKSTKTAYESIFETYKISANKDFQYLTSNKEVMELLKDFKYSNINDKKVLRGLLYRVLQKQYEYSKQNGVRQYHFHTHEGKSLLRFHNLPNNSDSILKLRTSIRNANIKLESSFGFEGGRVFPGFRYVFPIIFENDHLGSVEFSLAFEAFEERLNSVLPSKAYILIMNKDTTINKVFNSYKKYFKKSTLSNDFYIENEIISKITKTTKNNSLINKINSLLKSNELFKQNFNLKKDFSIPIIYDSNAYIINFLAIYNTDKQFSSYIISYKEQKDLMLVKSKYNYFMILGSISILVFIYVLFIAIFQREKTLKQKKRIEKNHNDLQKILDYQNNIIILYENSKMKQVNKSFLKFFDIGSITQFTQKNHCISTSFKFSTNKDSFTTEIFYNALKNRDISSINHKTIEILNPKTNKVETFLLNIDFYHHNGYIIVLTNISKLVELQNIINTQSKVAAVGEMIGNIAHQWRQPLSAISADITGLKLRIEYFNELNEKEVVSCIDRVNDSVKYLSNTIDDFRDFFKDDTDKATRFNLKDLIDEKINNLIKDSMKNNYIEIVSNLEDIYIFHNENIFLQALLNILNNSKDAFIQNNTNKERYIFIDILKDDNNAYINIYDNAGGINHKIIDKIFEPYFTTKHQSMGTGIGLYMTHQIISKQLNGEIKVENTTYSYKNKEYKGAEFKISIPL